MRSNNKKVLVAEDDHDLIELLTFNLRREGFKTSHTTDGDLVLPQIRRFAPDLLILDLMLPGMDGLEVCRQLRQSDSYETLRVLMLTARSEEADRIVGLELGADDYVTKPFSVRELMARVRALLRRQEGGGAQAPRIQLGPLTIDARAHRVTVSDRPVDLSALEFRLLHFLASNPGIVFSRNQLLDRVWGIDRNVTARSVDVYVRRLREKLEREETQPRFVHTVHGVGYRFWETEN